MSKTEEENRKKDQGKTLQSMQKQLLDSEQRFKELRDKMNKLNEKKKSVSEELEAEKDACAKLRKEVAQVESQRTTETRKAALEISKLKVLVLIFTSTYTMSIHTYVCTFLYDCT